MKNRSLKVSSRLFIGFAVIVALIIILGITSLFQFRTLRNFTIDMHNHPLTVSNAVRDIKVDTYKIEYNLDRILYKENEESYQVYVREIQQLESEIDLSFDLVFERFLGDKTDIDDASSEFKNILPVIDQIINLYISGELDKAIELRENQGRESVLLLTEKIDKMAQFAYGKGEEFYNDALKQSDRINTFTIVFLLAIILLSVAAGLILSFGITRPLGKLVSYVERLAIGDQDFIIDVPGDDEIGTLADSLVSMQKNIEDVVFNAKRIADGQYDGKITPRSVKDDLSITINRMTESLRDLKYNNDYSDWIKSGINLLNESMRGDKNLAELSSIVVTTIADYVDASVGTLYLFNTESGKLKQYSSYAYSKRKSLNNIISLGEGIAGQAALEKKIITITDIPEDYIEVSSGLGSSNPSNLVVFPFSFNNELKGVIELGSFNIFGDREFDLFKSLDETIGVSFNSCETRESMRRLLEQQQLQAKELVAQQEELRATNEELEEKTESLTKSEMKLKQQQEELKMTNEELEEKTEFLEKQRDEINLKNSELEVVRDDIIQKAKNLELSSKYKSEFMANMSHELRTPLNSLLILSKDLLANKGDRLNSDDLKSAEIIYNSGNELLQLINEILDLAKIESGKTELDIKKVKISKLEEGIENYFTALAKEKGIELILNNQNAPDSIVSDEQKINQILKNLLSNAFKFTREGYVKVNFSEVEDYDLLIEVEDSGIGIPEDKQSVIFDAFKQVDGSTSREFGGTGLGLSISRELSSLLGGELTLQSEFGKGSTFRLLLKSHTSVNTDPTEKVIEDKVISNVYKVVSKGEVEDDRESIRDNDNVILIVEDDVDFAYVLKKSCNEHNFKALIAVSGEEGLEIVEEYNPNAVILDVKLPGMNGLTVLDHLKANSKTRHLPVHVISGDDRNSEVFNKGVLGFLQKPIDDTDLDLLFKKITKVIDKKVKDLLIVEDDDDLRYSIEKLIGNGDVYRTCVSTGKEALKKLNEKDFDCMILDLSLPDISGFEVLEEIEKLNPETKPPVIIYTGRELSLEEEYVLRKYSSSIIIKGVHSQERLLDETSLFLHRIIKNLPEQKQDMISRIYDSDSVFREKEILIVDDDMRNIFALSKIIEDKGMVVHKAVNGEKAIEYLEKNHNIDLVLMDIMMPVMDGYEAMEQIRNNNQYNNVPIIALTAKAMKEDRDKCFSAGADDYMTKPLDPDRLLSLMRVWLYK